MKWRRSGRGSKHLGESFHQQWNPAINCGRLRGSRLCSRKRPHTNVLTVRLQRNLPIAIRPIDPRTNRFEARNNFWRWMPERIVAAAADERDLRVPCVEERLRRRGAAAVMGSPEQKCPYFSAVFGSASAVCDLFVTAA